MQEKKEEQNKEDFPEARKFLNNRIKKISFIIIVVLLGSFATLVLARVPNAVEKQKTEEAIAKIHATKLTMADVMGENLPPDPGEAADDTIEGIDANQNGIRDDVELAIFKEYPHSAKIRAALLQYALVLQMYMSQSIINSEVVVSVLAEESRANMCIAELVTRPGDNATNEDYAKFITQVNKYDDFVKTKHINNAMRDDAERNFLEYLDSYGSLDGESCDINLSILTNL